MRFILAALIAAGTVYAVWFTTRRMQARSPSERVIDIIRFLEQSISPVEAALRILISSDASLSLQQRSDLSSLDDRIAALSAGHSVDEWHGISEELRQVRHAIGDVLTVRNNVLVTGSGPDEEERLARRHAEMVLRGYISRTRERILDLRGATPVPSLAGDGTRTPAR